MMAAAVKVVSLLPKMSATDVVDRLVDVARVDERV